MPNLLDLGKVKRSRSLHHTGDQANDRNESNIQAGTWVPVEVKVAYKLRKGIAEKEW